MINKIRWSPNTGSFFSAFIFAREKNIPFYEERG
nr:MAG TPA: hypothetical protein [Caudoviricetes sp.]